MKRTKRAISFARRNKAKLAEAQKGTLARSISHLKRYERNALLLLSLECAGDLVELLKMEFDEVENLIEFSSYRHYTIPKKRGGVREIHAPSSLLKQAQKRLNFFLQAYYLCIKPEEAHGFVVNPKYFGKECNIVENAKPHTGKKHILNIDLKDFFPSISAKRVYELFKSKHFLFSEDIAVALALLTTYDKKLPIGSPTSPVISNFIALSLDHDLKVFCEANNLAYTRYADDLTFSSDTHISEDSLLDIVSIIRKNDFQINEKKLRMKSSSSRQTVTGLVVNEKVNVDRNLLKQIRAMLHDVTKNGVEIATRKHFRLQGETVPEQTAYFVNQLRGYINFVGQVRGKADSMYMKYKAELEKTAFHISA